MLSRLHIALVCTLLAFVVLLFAVPGMRDLWVLLYFTILAYIVGLKNGSKRRS